MKRLIEDYIKKLNYIIRERQKINFCSVFSSTKRKVMKQTRVRFKKKSSLVIW